MKVQSLDYVLAIIAGVLLALMIDCNSLLASFTSSVQGAWIAHGVGMFTSVVLIVMLTRFLSPRLNLTASSQPRQKSPIWSYFGGVPGAMTVVLAAITVNNGLGLSASLALMLVGQILFGFACDVFGWFGVRKRSLNWQDLLVVSLILIGSVFIIFFRA